MEKGQKKQITNKKWKLSVVFNHLMLVKLVGFA